MTDSLLTRDIDGVRVLTVNRAPRRNALDAETVAALADAVIAASADSSVRAIVLTGAGDHFSAGGDASSIIAAIDDPADGSTLNLMRTFHRAVEAIFNSPLPVIAAVRGAAYGGSFNLALACDLIVASEDARFCQVFLRRGVIPDLGGGFLLPRLVGMQRAKELMFRTREILAPEALSMGIVNEIVTDAEARAIELASEISQHSAIALSLTKRLVNESTSLSLHSSLELEATLQALVLETKAAREGFDAFRPKA